MPLFSVRETKVAIVADLGSLQRLPHIIGKGHVAELAYTGKDITAARAESIGLVNDVSARRRRRAGATPRAMAAEIAANSPLAVQGTKAVLDRRRGHDRWPRASTTWPPGTPGSSPPTTSPRR